MEQTHLKFINKVLISNDDIQNQLSIEQPIPYLKLDNYLRVQLILFYFHINKNVLNDPSNKRIYKMIESNDYTIEGDYLVNSEDRIPIIDLISIIEDIEEDYDYYVTPKYNGTIRIYDPTLKDKAISFEQFEAILKKQHTDHLIKDEVILKDELDYLDKMKDKSNNLLSSLIYKLLTKQKLIDIDYADIQFLFGISYINLLFTYMNDKTPIPYDELNISLAKTCINKMIYDEKEIEELDQKIDKISYRTNHLNSLLNYYKNYVPNSEATVTDLEYKIGEIMRKEFELGIELIELKQDPEIFNKHFLDYMLASIKHGTIDYNNTIKDPIISFFDLEGRKLKCYFDIHLSDLLKIATPSKILNHLNYNQILELKKR